MYCEFCVIVKLQIIEIKRCVLSPLSVSKPPPVAPPTNILKVRRDEENRTKRKSHCMATFIVFFSPSSSCKALKGCQFYAWLQG